jgi:hypothetical protein
MREPARARTALAAFMLITAAALSACAQIPVISKSQLLKADPSSQRITVYDAHGPLTARESRKLLARLWGVYDLGTRDCRHGK